MANLAETCLLLWLFFYTYLRMLSSSTTTKEYWKNLMLDVRSTPLSSLSFQLLSCCLTSERHKNGALLSSLPHFARLPFFVRLLMFISSIFVCLALVSSIRYTPDNHPDHTLLRVISSKDFLSSLWSFNVLIRTTHPL